ncbi:DEAD/DEAH box helicase [Irregularibacter muris]|uniref:ATP-dependent RNA helicase DbpA n=1 Tax=Irregularibacter muris TaxID=1796619 RepID=A0AAE3HDV8_9FIRM|nr:DEAD/DEAH box helicase [Irregularibacter muris]MCR1897650.1 DEAD/DEAH box helicase [Irregularibacter muris]
MNKVSFQDFKLDEKIIRALEKLGYMTPTNVQEKVLPSALESIDLIVKSQTGSGKTAAFAIPICERIEIEENSPQALILVPTRELAVQVKEELFNIGRFKRIRCEAIFGKQSFERQVRELKQRVHIIVGTPGRTLDHIQKGNINLEKINYLVIDEADKMLNMGFIEDVETIIKTLPISRTTMLFSATIPEKILYLCEKHMEEPKLIEISSKNPATERIQQYYYPVEEKGKFSLLNKLIYVYRPDSCILFCNTKNTVNWLLQKMQSKGYRCGALHGGMEQEERLTVMKEFRQGTFGFLIATDVAARGIDIENINLVVNFDVPVEKESYIHRIGRTGRAEKQGVALTLVTPREVRWFNQIEDYLAYKISPGELPSEKDIEQGRKAFQEQVQHKPKMKKDKGLKLNQEITKIYIKAGKNKKIRPGDILGAMTSIQGIASEDIGIIDIQDNISYVDILNGKEKIVLNQLPKTTIKGKKIKVDRAIK